MVALNTVAFAQAPGDLNCNGFVDVNDIVHAINLLIIQPCEMVPTECALANGDVDGDGIILTLSDFILIPFFLTGGSPPDYPRHPGSDTILVESTIAHPGETIALPLWVKTIDTLMAYQFLLEVNTDYLEFDTVIVYNGYSLGQHNCDGNIYCTARGFSINSYSILPGNHHIADIILTVNPDINQHVTTYLSFTSDPPQLLYSGFSNYAFFLPVMVDAEIEILPLSDAEWTDEFTPTDFMITAYPNPFNDALSISIISDRASQITVYDIMGRPVKSFEINAGNNLINWNANDINDKSVSAGIYFIGENRTGSFRKVLYLK